MRDTKTYTAKEIQYNIDTLTNRMNSLKLNRTEISKDINKIAKQIASWQDMDTNQFNMF